jgi:FlaG/FlaF family flagellin (archaellin)
MKGVSTIIASILMVVITIGLISVAYLYLSGIISGTTAQNIALFDAYCEPADNNITVLIKNDGTIGITANNIRWYVDGVDRKTYMYPATGCNDTTQLGAGNTVSCTIFGGVAGVNTPNGFRELRVIGPSNAVGGTVECK